MSCIRIVLWRRCEGWVDERRPHVGFCWFSGVCGFVVLVRWMAMGVFGLGDVSRMIWDDYCTHEYQYFRYRYNGLCNLRCPQKGHSTHQDNSPYMAVGKGLALLFDDKLSIKSPDSQTT